MESAGKLAEPLSPPRLAIRGRAAVLHAVLLGLSVWLTPLAQAAIMGEATPGPGSQNAQNAIFATRFRAPSTFDARYIDFYNAGTASGEPIELVLYNDSGGATPNPTTLYFSTPVSVNYTGWNFFQVPTVTLVNGNYYWLGLQGSGPNTQFSWQIFTDNTVGMFSTYGTLPSPWPTPYTFSNNLALSIYATDSSPTSTVTKTSTITPTPTLSPTVTVSGTPTAFISRTSTPTFTRTPTSSATLTRTVSLTATNSPTRTATGTPTALISRTVTSTRTATATRTPTPTRTVSATATPYQSRTISPTASVTPVVTPGPGGLVSAVSNYPNPFAPPAEETRFAYALYQNANVDAAIYTYLGNLVRTLHAAAGEAGGQGSAPGTLNQLAWDGRDAHGQVLASGGYLARITITTGDGRQVVVTRKVAIRRP